MKWPKRWAAKAPTPPSSKLMQIMTDKGLVKRDDSTRTHVYKATSSEDQMQRQLVTDLLDKVFEGSAAKLVLQALDAGKDIARGTRRDSQIARRASWKDQRRTPMNPCGSTSPAGPSCTSCGKARALPRSPSCCSSGFATAPRRSRYVVACIALVAMVAAPLVTAAVLSRSVATPARIR